jgi:hypothetical protein
MLCELAGPAHIISDLLSLSAGAGTHCSKTDQHDLGPRLQMTSLRCSHACTPEHVDRWDPPLGSVQQWPWAESSACVPGRPIFAPQDSWSMRVSRKWTSSHGCLERSGTGPRCASCAELIPTSAESGNFWHRCTAVKAWKSKPTACFFAGLAPWPPLQLSDEHSDYTFLASSICAFVRALRKAFVTG